MRRVTGKLRGGDDAEITSAEFNDLLRPFLLRLAGQKAVAVAVSGGADSLALLYLLSCWSAAGNGPEIHAVTVDHGLRPESRDEARQVAVWARDWPRVVHHVLTWRGTKPKTRILEAAREKRYALLRDFCKHRCITCLFVAHQMEDQAETVLMRLCAGSGLEGLSGMQAVTSLDGVFLLRPLLPVSHARLMATLRAAGQTWIEDPSNQNKVYLRPRLRAVAEALAAEGLSARRLSVLASRMARAQTALHGLADQAWAQVEEQKGAVQIPLSVWEGWPEETRGRILARALAAVGGAGRRNPARLEQIEELAAQFGPGDGKICRRTLGGCVVTRGVKWLKISRELPRSRKS